LQDEISTALKVWVKVICVVTPWRTAVGYQHFEGPCYFHPPPPEDGAARPSKAVVSYYNTPRHHNPEKLDFKLFYKTSQSIQRHLVLTNS